MRVSTVLLLVALTVATLMLNRCDANVMCLPCLGEECNNAPDNCLHGVTRDYCGRKVCAKGPGQKCGGPSNILGRCGDGLHCQCERCAGCSLATLDCYPTDIRCQL